METLLRLLAEALCEKSEAGVLGSVHGDRVILTCRMLDADRRTFTGDWSARFSGTEVEGLGFTPEVALTDLIEKVKAL
jgi:hypothetical protein